MKKIVYVLILVFSVLFVLSCSSGKDDNDSNNDSDSTGEGPRCGNGVIDEGEICDGDIPCWQAGHFYPEFEAKCNADCTAYDTKKCQKRPDDDLCGNFVKDDKETCEQGETKLCTELPGSYVTGDAACNRWCTGWDPTNCSTGGNKTCAQIFTCVDACADDACIEGCRGQGSEQGLELFNALYECWTGNCASGADREECMKQNCNDEYYSCYPGEKCGNGVIDEGEKCESLETKPCQEFGEDWQPINEAICNSTCTDWDMYACIDKDALTCYQVYECVEKCDNSECEEECIAKTWPAAKAKYDTMLECLDKECSDAPVMEVCMNEFCKFQTDACKTHLTCGNSNIDMYENCEKGESVDCGTIEDEQGEAMYEAGTANAFCNTNCTEYITLMCFKFCSCSEIKTCVEQECGGYSN
ncbi:MAG TPA: hypothetical protein PLB16_10760, partial [bacterium]|nr:hypothetical protein [bacterium]